MEMGKKITVRFATKRDDPRICTRLAFELVHVYSLTLCCCMWLPQWSDHWRKGFPYEFSAHVPLLFRWPEKYQPTATMKRGHVETELVTELRDVFPTMLDAAGAMSTIPTGHQIDGMSLLCLLKDPSGKSCTGCTSATGCSADGKGWRAWVDLEHSTCYNATNHWSALTDGKMKYIFNACPTCSFPAKEQLFNLTADPVRTIANQLVFLGAVQAQLLTTETLRHGRVSKSAYILCQRMLLSSASGAVVWWLSSRKKAAATLG